ncbi:MAG: glycoside hydrolase family 43 protein [Bryobacteraceae bacterium]|jgi:xylan 1,4-beta-xylosidase
MIQGMPDKIRNPILRGFHPDPSIVRVGGDYYIATSTFEWYPGVEIHHSRDLAHWRLVRRPLERATQLNMLGDPDSCGIWAPCLSYADGLFYLVYTDVKRYGRSTAGPSRGVMFRDMHNHLVTGASVEGEWSEPVDLNSSGFDPSLFHDEDGRKYLVNMVWDYRPGRNRFAGIALQEYSVAERRLTGTARVIFEGTALGFTEGPHLYKRRGWYYLLTAEGGTGYGHAVTLARSRDLRGPYEVHPDGPILTSRDRPELELQRAGHADLVETQHAETQHAETGRGETYLVHLCGRPLSRRGRCTLGRETAIQKMAWGEDGWLRTADGRGLPRPEVDAPDLPACVFPAAAAREEFDGEKLAADFQWLRSPWPEELFSLTERPGHLRLYGRESLGSLFRQALVARRQQSHRCSAETVMEFDPESFQQMAGLVCYYSGVKFHYLYVSHDAELGKHVGVMSCHPDAGQPDLAIAPRAIREGAAVGLRVEVDRERLRFAYRVGREEWQWIGEEFDASILSDEAGPPGPNFTGAFVGMCCQDLAGTAKAADFDFFEYLEAPE